MAFAVTTYVEEVRIAVKANSGINSIKDLANKTVATTTGTTSVQTLRKHERSTGVDFKGGLREGPRGQLPAAGIGPRRCLCDGRLHPGQEHRHVQEPKDYKIVGEVLSVEPIAIMMRKDDPAFKKVVDNSIKELIRLGDLAKLYDKWFLKPIPPAGAVIGMPAERSHQGGLGQSQRQADGRLRQEVKGGKA